MSTEQPGVEVGMMYIIKSRAWWIEAWVICTYGQQITEGMIARWSSLKQVKDIVSKRFGIKRHVRLRETALILDRNSVN